MNFELRENIKKEKKLGNNIPLKKFGMNLGMNWNQFVKNEYITIVNIVYMWEKKGMLPILKCLHISNISLSSCFRCIACSSF